MPKTMPKNDTRKKTKAIERRLAKRDCCTFGFQRTFRVVAGANCCLAKASKIKLRAKVSFAQFEAANQSVFARK